MSSGLGYESRIQILQYSTTKDSKALIMLHLILNNFIESSLSNRAFSLQGLYLAG